MFSTSERVAELVLEDRMAGGGHYHITRLRLIFPRDDKFWLGRSRHRTKKTATCLRDRGCVFVSCVTSILLELFDGGSLEEPV